jgi:transcriptional regulator with XRE-family HTH domain
MTFAEQLKSQRQRLGLTQSEVADLLEVSASWVDKAEREIRTPIKITQEGAIARLSRTIKLRRRRANDFDFITDYLRAVASSAGFAANVRGAQ